MASKAKAQRDFEKLVDKLSGRAQRGLPIYMLADEVQLLVASMNEITTQAMLLQQVIIKYPELWDNLVESLRVDVPGASEDRDGNRGDSEVDPENLHNQYTPEPEPVRPVAG